MFPDGLQTARLVLRPIARGDTAAIFDGYAQDREVTRFMTWRPHTSLADAEAYVARCLEAGSARTYALVARVDAALLGAFELRRHAMTGPTSHRLGFGYVLARAAWGRGLMTEALTAAAEWALAQPDIWRIGDVCDIENYASARVMAKAGLTCEGILRRWTLHPNISDEPRDCLSYARVR
jgi:RimJ/RimL family protein N-acetyltransferase